MKLLRRAPRSIRRKKYSGVDWESAPDIKREIAKLIDAVGIDWVDKDRIFCFRSSTSTSRAYARIWGLSRVWQKALNTTPAYVIEVLSQRFDRLSKHQQAEVLLHEIAHIPQNFSGSLLPHVRRRGKRNFEDRVHELVNQYRSKK